MSGTEALGTADLLRYLWVDNSNTIRAKGVYLPPVRETAASAAPAALRPLLERAVSISQAQYALPVMADAVVFEAGLLPLHDVTLVPDWDTLRALPYSAGMAAVACDLYDGDEPWEFCPRGFLRRMVAAAEGAGLVVRAGVELEFVLLTPAGAATGGAHPGLASTAAPVAVDRAPFALDAAFDTHREVLLGIAAALRAQGVDVAQMHPEAAAGQLEISLRHLPPLAMADAVVAARQTVHAVAAKHGLLASFLPVVDADDVASGMHVHLSLTGEATDGLGPQGDSFLAGILEHLVALLAVTAPTPMSLARFRPHYWAGAFIGWGPENKEAPLRVVPGTSGRPRDVEFKALDASANPYLALAALLAAGLDGVARGATLPPALPGDPGLLSDADRAAAAIARMPTDPAVTLDALAADRALGEAWGERPRAAYLAVKRAETAALAGLAPSDRRALLLERY